MNRHYLNKPGFYKLAQSVKDYINRKITGYAKLGTASTKDFTTYVSPTQTEQLPISSSVYSAMTNMLRGAYHPAGSKTIAELTSDLLVKANLGNVYKITEDGVTSNLFIGGAGQTIKTGDNAIVLYASEDTYKFSLESGVVDLDAYQKKELTSGALIEDVIPTNASASNQLVTATGSVDRISTNNWIPDDFDKAIPADGASFKIFTVLNSASHTPATGANYIVIAIAFQSAIIQQEAIQNGTNNRYIRYLNNGSWSSWQKLVTRSDLRTVLYVAPHSSQTVTLKKNSPVRVTALYFGGVCEIAIIAYKFLGTNTITYKTVIFSGSGSNSYSLSVDSSTGILTCSSTGTETIQFIIEEIGAIS